MGGGVPYRCLRPMVWHYQSWDGVFGLTGDLNALAGSMDWLITNETERKLLAAGAPEVLLFSELREVMGVKEEVVRKAVR
jgi:hypothetical protein